VNLVAIMIVIVTFWGVSIIFNLKDNYSQSAWTPKDCGPNAANILQADAYADWQLNDKDDSKKNLMYCYCFEQF